MAKTWEQILDEVGEVPPEQTMQDKKDLIAEIGEAAFSREWQRVAWERAERRFSRDTSRPIFPPKEEPELKSES